MSAESPRRVTRKTNAGHIVLPQPVSDLSLIDSVAGFIQDVVPQAYSGSTGDGREVITWARVQQADINDPALYPDTGEQDGVPPLLLVLGYGSGVQVWSLPASSEAREVLSWSQGSVRTLCVLPSPELRPANPRQDLYRHKRPLVAIVDNAGPGPQFCAVSFISLRDGEQVKSIKFSHQVWEVVATRRSVVITLAEKIAVFDASTLEDNLSVTTCYPSPDVNPIALGSRWLAYAERRLSGQLRSLGGCHGEGPQSVTATVFQAAKLLSRGLRDLSETVASSLTGSSPENSYTHSNIHPHPYQQEASLKGIVTIIDTEKKLPKDGNEEEQKSGANRIVAHFSAHLEPIVAMSFDPSGLLLVTADKRGHRFHVFRINPHPCGPTLAFVQHLYILYRGDTTAQIQDIAFSEDSRWVAISSMRGTTHVFPILPYGGPIGVRTHTTPHVVNKLSRFHRSAGLMDEGRNSPVLWEGPPSTPPPGQTPPTTVTPLAQVRRQSPLVPPTEESVVRVAASFGPPRAPTTAPTPTHARTRRPIDSLYVMACNGSLIQYDLDPRPFSGVSKEKVCDDTGIELFVEAKAEWILQRPPYSSALHPPLPCTNPLLTPLGSQPLGELPSPSELQTDDERWLSQVEIVTHAGPHRRLWMGPQFTFITVNSNNESGDIVDMNKQILRSNPVNMPLKQPLIIESGSCSSLELSPNLVELVYKTDCSWSCRLREDLAEAMMDVPTTRNAGGKGMVRREPVIERQVNPLGSVVTLTAQLNIPAELLSDDRKVKVVGTETKKITLESRFNKSVMKTQNQSFISENAFSFPMKTDISKLSELDVPSVDIVKTSFKSKQKSNDFSSKNDVKVLIEVNENVTVPLKKMDEKDVVVETLEKKGKNGKSKRKISKGEKNKIKSDGESKLFEDQVSSTNDSLPVSDNSLPVVDIDMPVYECSLEGQCDIEMQLREASYEREIELESEDYKSRKRSLETSTDVKIADLSCEIDSVDKIDHATLQYSDKTASRQRKKSRTNGQEVCTEKGVIENRQNNESANTKSEQFGCGDAYELTSKPEEKNKTKKKKSKKACSLNTSVCDEANLDAVNSLEEKAPEHNTEQLLLEVSQETLCPEFSGSIVDMEIQNYDNSSDTEPTKEIRPLCSSDIVFEEHHLNTSTTSEGKNSMTDDELRGFESDLLVKDCSTWSPEKTPEKDIDIFVEDKDSDKEIDKVKNYETTDKDSSDDCQPTVVKSDSNKHVQKRGKNRKPSRKTREIDGKMLDFETNEDEPGLEAKIITDTDEKDQKETQNYQSQEDEPNCKIDSEEEFFMDAKKNEKENNLEDELFLNSKVSTDGVRRRVRKRDSADKDTKVKLDELPNLDVPKKPFSSVVGLGFEDPNGNFSKPDEPVASVRSWSSIAATPAKTKSQETVDTTKTSSVEDRDSVYESCNDSVGEEVEPAPDSLGSCYYELELEGKEDSANVIEPTTETSSQLKNGGSCEDKSNTDSGEKDDQIVGIQATSKKSKKQKKKKR